jgi:uncharacterized protein YggU (UPF0235/DUF167 family)
MEDSRKYHLHDGQSGSALAVRVIPRSRQNQVAEVLNDGTVKIRLVGAENEEKMNKALIEYLSEILNVDEERIEIVAGKNGHEKLVTVVDLDTAILHEKIMSQLT